MLQIILTTELFPLIMYISGPAELLINIKFNRCLSKDVLM